MNHRIPITVVIKRSNGCSSDNLLEAFVSEEEADKFINKILEHPEIASNRIFKIRISLNLINPNEMSIV